MAERILVADDDPVLRTLIAAVLEAQGFEVVTVPSGDALVRVAREVLPDLLLIDVMMPVMDGLEAVRQLRNDTRTGHLPMLLITAQAAPRQAVIGLEIGADDYITKPFDNDLLVARVKANLRRAARMPVNSPLTGMSGNLLIEEEVNYRLRHGRSFALLWVDLDNFKSFNDAYGFARGDRVIRLVGDLIAEIKHARGSEEDFVGHIGGDDFVIVTDPAASAEISEQLIERFDVAIVQFYDAPEMERGYLLGLDRYGTPRRFPLVSLSIGIVDTSKRTFDSYEEVSNVAAELKSFAKKTVGSSFAIDERRRRSPSIDTDRRGQPPLVILQSADQQLADRLCAAVERASGRSRIHALPRPSATILAEGPELVVVDSTPNGWQMLDELRAAAPGLPIILVTTVPDEDERAIAAGASAALPDTVTAEQFLITVADLLRLQESSLPLDEMPS